MDARAKLLELASLYDAACETPAVGKLADGDQWQSKVLEQFKRIDEDPDGFRRIYNQLARSGRFGWSLAPEHPSWFATLWMADKHPDKLNAEYAQGTDAVREVLSNNFWAIVSLRAYGAMCRALAKMLDCPTAASPAASPEPQKVNQVTDDHPRLDPKEKILLLTLRAHASPVKVKDLHALALGFLRAHPELRLHEIGNADDFRKKTLKGLKRRELVCFPNGRYKGVVLNLAGKSEADAVASKLQSRDGVAPSPAGPRPAPRNMT